ncbi:hypothetical protein [Streptomyces sp. NPDC056401]|uniref:hypothetical protein n=1 Tax=Streptomyces sp. NPDC056401 TaxID=3345809 RepID=UPI0035E32E20
MAHDLLTELMIGGVWTPIPNDVYARSPVVIERGRRDEDAVVGPSKVRLQLNNRNGQYSPRNPYSTLQIGRNTPIRCSVPGTESYLSLDGNTANTSAATDHASFTVTDLDVRAELTVDWTSNTLNQTILGQWGSDGNRGWIWRLYNGTSSINWTTSGAVATGLVATIPLPVLPRRAALRWTLDVNNGAGGWTGSLYWAPSLDGPWTLVGTTTGVGVTSIYDSGAPLRVAPAQSDTNPPRAPFTGRGHRFELRASIGGAVVAAPDYRSRPPGNTSFLDSAGRSWSFAGTAAVSNREYRGVAEIPSWPARWDTSGKDVYVPIEAAGILRRLGQGSKALASTLRRRIPTVGLPRAYWPLEEGTTATQAYSPIAGVAPLTTVGFEWAVDSDLAGSAPLPRITAAASMSGAVPMHAATGQWMVACVYNLPTAPVVPVTLLEFTTTGLARRIVLDMDGAGNVGINGYSATGTTVFTAAAIAVDFDGQWNRLEITATESGANTTFTLGWVAVGGSGFTINSVVAATAGTVTGINTSFSPGAVDLRLGHLGVFSSATTTVYNGGDGGWNGETAAARIRRLSTEEGVPAISGFAPTRMGPQLPSPLLTLLDECAAADVGVLYESMDRLGLRYRGRQQYYNQPVALTLDYDQNGHVSPPLEPVDDDQGVRNDRIVTRRGGSSARAVDETSRMSIQAPPAGIGTYDDERTLNLRDDNQTDEVAWWLLHLGTWDGVRYPSVHINLAAAPSLIGDVLALDIGDRIQITNPPPWLPPGPIDLIVEGWTETFGHPNSWDIVLNCTAAGPWTVAVTDDAGSGKADTDGSTLVAAATSSATTLVVHTTQTADGMVPLWTEDPAEYPLDLLVGGEVVTASAAAPLAADTFTRTVAAGGWGTSSDGHTYTATGGPASDRSVAATYAVVTLVANPTTHRYMTVAETAQDCDLRASIAFSATATGGSLAASVIARWTSSSDYYRIRVEGTTAGGITLTVTRGTTVVGSSVATGVTYTPGSVIEVRMRIVGDRILGRVWPTGAEEPCTWHIDETITSSPISEGQVGLAGSALTGNSNVSPEIRLHSWAVETPQKFTVTRSANGVVKAQAATEKIQLAQPATVAY